MNEKINPESFTEENNSEKQESKEKFKGLLHHVWDSLEKDDMDRSELPNYENFKFNHASGNGDNDYYTFLEGEDEVEISVQIPCSEETKYKARIWKNNELMYEE